jgi:transcriptional regulator with XRE-family HTH domain
MNKLAYWRAKRFMTVRGLADKTQVLFGKGNGVNAASISRIENGHNRPFMSTLGKLAAALEIDLAELVELAEAEAQPIMRTQPAPAPEPTTDKPTPAPVASVSRPVASEQPTRRAKPKTIDDIAGQIQTDSVELKLYQGQGAGIMNREIEARIDWLQDPKRSKRLFSPDYKRIAVAYLQEELGRRRVG